jgi:hypothetical protein
MLRGRAAWVVPALLTVSIVACSGAGFASFEKSATVNGQASRASFDLVIVQISILRGPLGIELQTTSLPATLASAWINNTPSAAKVNLSVVVENVGTVPAQNVTSGLSTSTIGYNPRCEVGTGMAPAAPNVPPTGVLAPGASLTTYWAFTAGQNLTACSGQTFFQFTIGFVADAGV